MKMLIDFANIKDFSYESVESYHRRYNIYFSVEGQQRGYEKACFSKYSTSMFLFYSSPDFEDHSKGAFLSSSAENEKKMSFCLKKSQVEYQKFLSSCSEGHLPVNFIKERISQFKGSSLTVAPTNHPFRVSFELELSPRNIETFIDIYEIIYPLWRGEGEEFSRIKRCRNCSDFFYARSLKAEFCSVKCKNAFNYRKINDR